MLFKDYSICQFCDIEISVEGKSGERIYYDCLKCNMYGGRSTVGTGTYDYIEITVDLGENTRHGSVWIYPRDNHMTCEWGNSQGSDHVYHRFDYLLSPKEALAKLENFIKYNAF